MVRCAAQQIQNLCPQVRHIASIGGYFLPDFSRQVINAARILSSRPKSKVAQENMEVCGGLDICLL